MAISRRALIAGGGAAIAAGAAGVTALALRLDESTPGVAGPSHTPVATPTPKTSPTHSPAPTNTTVATPTPLPRGGSLRRSSFTPFDFDTFDALRTGEASTLEVLARTHSRLVQWETFPSNGGSGVIGPDIAAKWEQPSPTRLVLTLDPRAMWQEAPGMAARRVTAADVVEHLQRAIALSQEVNAPAVQRAWSYASFATLTAPSESTVAIEFSRPEPLALEALAGRFALVQRPEAVETFAATWHETAPESASGSGPWSLNTVDRERLQFRANRTGHREPLLDNLEVHAVAPRIWSGGVAGRNEWLARDRRDAAEMTAAKLPGWSNTQLLADSPLISTFDAAAAPWNDPRLVRALELALNRRFLASSLFAGRAVGASVIPPHFGDAPPNTAAGFGEPDADATQARQLWAASGAAQAGDLLLDVPTIFDPVYSAGATIAARLTQVLGVTVRLAGESYTAIARKAGDHYYGNGRLATWFGWGTPIAEPSVERWLAETYLSSSATAMSNSYSVPEVDQAIAKALTQFGSSDQKAQARAVAAMVGQDKSGGVITWLAQRYDLFRDSSVTWQPPSVFAAQHLDAKISRV